MTKVLDMLKLFSTQTIIGTSVDKSIDFYSDIDLQEINIFKYNSQIYKKILKRFQKIFNEADRNTIVTDFKCGVSKGNVPIRWNKETINDGFQFIDNRKVIFTSCLRQTSTIKIDAVRVVHGLFQEYSQNYYFNFGGQKTFNEFTKEQTTISLLRDYKKYIGESNPFKAIKRLYSAYKLNDITDKKIIRFLNSKTGKLNKLVSDLELCLFMIDFVDKELIIKNLKVLSKGEYKKEIRDIITSENLKQQLEHLIGIIKERVNEKTFEFISKYVNFIELLE
jgi:hypothetical protein